MVTEHNASFLTSLRAVSESVVFQQEILSKNRDEYPEKNSFILKLFYYWTAIEMHCMGKDKHLLLH